MDRIRSGSKTGLDIDNSRSSVPIHGTLLRSGHGNTNDYTKNHNHKLGHRYYKYFLAVVLGLGNIAPALANTDVGGVSATANPVANSSGSVTNQAIQVLQGPYITNTYGGGISCQGPTMNITPFVTGSLSQTHPYESTFDDPVYDMRDLDDDGAPDNPGSILYYVPTRTGQKNNSNISLGFSATWSRPMDRQLQDQCKKAAATQIALQEQMTANKRLDFEIARLKNCGELIKAGIMFHPRSEYAKICEDVIVLNKNYVVPHRHSIPSPSTSESRGNGSAADLGGPLQTRGESSSSSK